jgi:3-hydroxyacyl-CoA dehydrogenase
MSASVRIDHDAEVAILVIDNPPVNAAAIDVRRGLLDCIRRAAADPQIRAMVVMGAGTTFIAGADLREFDRPPVDPQLPVVIAAIEACEKPVVAALQGAALGGGLELALGCDARIALAGTVVGLPEVTLGIIPGAGGTQRLPRLVGLAKAISLVASGERISAATALALGLVDAVVLEDLRGAAVAYARTLAGKKRRVRDLAAPAFDASAVAQASAAALRAGKHRPAVKAAIDAVVSAAMLPIDEALARERERFAALRGSVEARALRHQFFAEREAARHPGVDASAGRPVERMAVIGAGTMGAGIAVAALDAGIEVSLLEKDDVALAAGVARIRDYYARRVSAGKLAAAAAAEREARLSAALDWSVLSSADLIIEAVVEDLTVKQEVFRRLGNLARPGAVLASNTSYLDLDAIAAATGRPQDVVGLHFFSPAQVMRLLEVVKGRATASDVLATGLQLARRLRKISVVSANAFGFIGNRIYSAYRRQCEFMLEEGASLQQIDTALEAFGFAMGPFAVGDLSGLDIGWRMRQSLAPTRDPHARYVRIADLLCEAGRFGRKTGAGYYRYGPDGGAQPDAVVDEVIARARAEKGIVPRAFDAAQITRRALLSMVNDAALLVEEGVAQRANDVDVVMVNGYGFPRWEGGPVFWARERGAHALALDLDWLARSSGPGFVRGETRYLLSSAPA